MKVSLQDSISEHLICAAPEMIQTAPKQSVFLRSEARLASLRTREALTLFLLYSGLKRFWEKTTVLQYRNGPHCFSRRTWNNPQLFLEWSGILTLWIKQMYKINKRFTNQN